MEDMQVNPNRIPTLPRNLLQAELLKLMLGDGVSDPEKQVVWAETYSKRVGEIIDNPENTEIRKLILEDKDFSAAADMVRGILQSELAIPPEAEQLKKAA